MLLEICAFTPQSALLAAASGAHRIELCANASIGGTTPSLSDFKTLIREVNIPVMVMIRPESGSFTPSPQEFEGMEDDMRSFLAAWEEEETEWEGGFVFGLLLSGTEEGVDVPRCLRLIILAAGRPCTFHRAFDSIPASLRSRAVNDIVFLGFKAILTSGGASDAVAGVEILKELVQRLQGTRCEVIVGGGVRSGNFEVLREGIGARWWHSSAILGGEGVDGGGGGAVG